VICWSAGRESGAVIDVGKIIDDVWT